MQVNPTPSVQARRPLWIGAGFLCLALGTIGIVVPLLPTVDMYGLAAFCFARGDRRWEAWLLKHPHLGPPTRAWRESGVVPLPAKCAATLSMGVSCAAAALWAPGALALLPLAFCVPLSIYLWTRPSQVTGLPCKN